MLTAAQAREIVNSIPKKPLQKIFDEIDIMAKAGTDFYYIDKKDVSPESLESLEQLGYKIQTTSPNNYRISW